MCAFVLYVFNRAAAAAAEQITWIDGFGTVLTQGISYRLEPATDMRRFTARSVLRVTPTKEMHDRTVVCQAQNTVDKAYRTAAIRLHVQYAPKVTVTVVNGALDSGQIPDGSTVDAMCVVDANPAEVTYRWYVNEELVPEQSARVMVSGGFFLGVQKVDESRGHHLCGSIGVEANVFECIIINRRWSM